MAARLTTHHADLRLLCFCAPLHSGAVFLAVLHRSRQLHRMHAKLREPRRLFFARGKGWAVPGPVVAEDSINSQAGGVGSNGTLPLAEFQRAVACYNGPLGTEVSPRCESASSLNLRTLIGSALTHIFAHSAISQQS